MKIVYSTDTYWPRINGQAVSIDSYKQEFEKMGHEVYVFAPDYPGAKEWDENNKLTHIKRFSGYPLMFTPTPEDRMVYPWKRKEVYAELDRIKPDIIHPQSEFPMCRLTWDYAIERKIPLLMTAHTYFEQYVNFYYPWLPHAFMRYYGRRRLARTYNKVEVLITPTNQMAAVLASYRVKPPINVIPTGFNIDDFSGVDKKTEKAKSHIYKLYPEIKGKKILFSAGRVGKEKNLIFLLDVVEKLKNDVPDVILLYAGDGYYFNELTSIIRSRGLEQNVKLLGYVNRPEMKYYYSLADVFIFSSKTETQGLVTMESMICKTPVVGIGIMGTREVMNGDNGGYMTGDDVNEFTGKVKLLLTDKKLYDKKSKEAYNYAKNWSSRKSAEKLLEIYKALIKKKR